ncbi:MAG: hypothetical protein WDM88_09640 [Galbitalea sp.]
MTRQLRRIGTLVLLMFIALFTSTTIIQVFSADQLKSDPRNIRTLDDSYSARTRRNPRRRGRRARQVGGRRTTRTNTSGCTRTPRSMPTSPATSPSTRPTPASRAP